MNYESDAPFSQLEKSILRRSTITHDIAQNRIRKIASEYSINTEQAKKIFFKGVIEKNRGNVSLGWEPAEETKSDLLKEGFMKKTLEHKIFEVSSKIKLMPVRPVNLDRYLAAVIRRSTPKKNQLMTVDAWIGSSPLEKGSAVMLDIYCRLGRNPLYYADNVKRTLFLDMFKFKCKNRGQQDNDEIFSDFAYNFFTAGLSFEDIEG